VTDTRCLLDATRYYHAIGAHPVALTVGSKVPPGVGWPRARYTVRELAHVFDARANVGLLLGDVSILHLADVDLDCPEAVALAPLVLSPTITFGRASKPRSHYLYRSPGAPYRRFTEPRPPGAPTDWRGATLLELRGNAAHGPGLQTVVPPSTHPSGEAIEWTDERDAVELADALAEVSAEVLECQVSEIAAVALIARHTSIAEAAAVMQGAPMPKLYPEVLDALRSWLGVEVPKPATSARVTPTPGGEQWIAAFLEAGVERVIHAFGLADWNERRRTLKTCPACRQDRRSRSDARPAAELRKAKKHPHHDLLVHGECKAYLDALAVASCIVIGETRPHNADQWRRLRAELVAKGLVS
jgi:hypothetical protein